MLTKEDFLVMVHEELLDSDTHIRSLLTVKTKYVHAQLDAAPCNCPNEDCFGWVLTVCYCESKTINKARSVNVEEEDKTRNASNTNSTP